MTPISGYDGDLFQFLGGQTLEQTAVVSAEELRAHVDSRKSFIESTYWGQHLIILRCRDVIYVMCYIVWEVMNMYMPNKILDYIHVDAR